MEADAVVVFTDIRGFTKWAESTEVFSNLEAFVSGFAQIIRAQFPEPVFVKALGDGAMIVDSSYSLDEDPGRRLAQVLEKISVSNGEFGLFCREFSTRIGHPADLRLGWSVVKGKVRRVADDFIGPNINRAARLCDVARPDGIVIERDDFPVLPPGAPRFYRQERVLPGLDLVRVWVTEEIQNQFLPRERLRQQPEVHVAGVCTRAVGSRTEVLLARRSEQRQLYPKKWEGCGGQLAPNESFTQGVQRHFKRELCLDVRALESVHCFYQIKEPNTPLIPGIRFLCELHGEAEPQISTNHTEATWVSEAQLRKMPDEDFVPGLKREISQLLQQRKA